MGKKTTSKTAAARKKDPPPASPASVAAQSASKRPRSGEDVGVSLKKVTPHATGGGGGGRGDGPQQAEEEELVFEDPFGDEFDPEDVDAMNAEQEEGGGDDGNDEAAPASGGAMDVIPEDATADAAEATPQETKVWRAGVDELEEGDELEYDSTAYHLYHSLRPEWPCLSFDVIRDSLGTNRSRYPHTVFAVAGTQADRADNNRLQVRLRYGHLSCVFVCCVLFLRWGKVVFDPRASTLGKGAIWDIRPVQRERIDTIVLVGRYLYCNLDNRHFVRRLRGQLDILSEQDCRASPFYDKTSVPRPTSETTGKEAETFRCCEARRLSQVI